MEKLYSSIVFTQADSAQVVLPCQSVASIVQYGQFSNTITVYYVNNADYEKSLAFNYVTCGFISKQATIDSLARWSICADSTGGGGSGGGISQQTLDDSIEVVRNLIFTTTDTSTITSFDVLNSLNTPPVSPSTGDVYLVGNSPTGAFVGHEKDIAEWNGSSWVFTDAIQGNFLYNATNAITYIYRSGNWVQTTGIPALNNGNTISSGLKIGTNNAKSLKLETNNVERGRIDSIGRLHIYNLPISIDTFVSVTDINGKFGKIGKSTFLSGLNVTQDSIYVYRTFADAKNQMIAHTLKSGVKYQLTDFTTIYDQPDFDSTGTAKVSVTTKTSAIEHLVFTATSDSTFASEVSSVEYPLDKLKFDFDFIVTEHMGAPAKGRITYREDSKGNITDYDFRNILFKRYERTTGGGVFSEWKDNGEDSDEFLTFGVYDYSFGNTFTGYTVAYSLLGQSFILPNVVFQGTAIKNKFDVVFNSTFVGDANENFIGDGSKNIIALGSMYYSYFGHQAWNVLFIQDSDDNYFGDKLENCTFGNGCYANSIWDKMTNFTAGNNFERNIQYGEWKNSTVGNNFTDGVIYGITDSITCGDNNYKIDLKSALAITIGNNNSNISFGGTKHIMPLNDFNGVKNVAFGGSIDGYNWSNGINTTDHPEFYQTTTKQVLKASNGNVYGRYFNGTTDVNTIIN